MSEHKTTATALDRLREYVRVADECGEQRADRIHAIYGGKGHTGELFRSDLRALLKEIDRAR